MGQNHSYHFVYKCVEYRTQGVVARVKTTFLYLPVICNSVSKFHHNP